MFYMDKKDLENQSVTSLMNSNEGLPQWTLEGTAFVGDDVKDEKLTVSLCSDLMGLTV